LTAARPRRQGRGSAAAAAAAARPARGGVRWTRWIAYGAIALYGLYWGVQAFTLHHSGNYAVETDFYWKYAPAADDLRHGRVDIANYDSKGWGYPAALAVVSMAGLDTFRAGQLLALLAACLAAWLVYRTHRSLFGPTLALLGLLLLLANETFVTNTYEVGTDMYFFAVAAGSIALLLRAKSPGLWAIAGSGALAGWAFATRYNGLFLWPGAVLQILVLREPRGERRERWLRVGIYSGAFAAAALPWLVINAVHTGNPLTNTNYLNVGYLVYGQGNWEKFFYGKERAIHSFLDVVALDPGRFLAAVAANTVEVLRRDLSELLPAFGAAPPARAGLPVWGLLAALGGIAAAWERPGRRALAYFAFGVLYFLTITPVFYGTRFSLPLLGFYTALASWGFASGRVGSPFRGIESMFPLRSFVFLLLWIPTAVTAYGRVLDPANATGIRAGAQDVDEATSFLRRTGRGEALVARKPHAAYRAGLRFVPLTDVSSLGEVRALAARERAKYMLLSGWELRRQALLPLANAQNVVPGFRLVFSSPAALVYEVEPPGPGPVTP
jgi:hypothetical protein